MIGERAADRVWPPELRRTLVLLGLACALEAFAYTVCVPFLTASLRADTGASTTVVAAVFIAHTLGSTLATPFVPRFIRSCGGCARGTALALVLLGTSEATCAFSRTAPVLFGARLVAGLAGGLVWSSVLSACALLARRHGGMASMFGSVIACVSVGTMAGPTVGGPLFRAAGWPAPFCAVALMCVALAAVVARAVERLPLTPPPAAVAVKLAAGCEGRATSLVLGSVCVGAVLFSSIDAVLPLLIEDALGDADRARFGPAGARTGPSGAPYALSTSLVFCAISLCYGGCAPGFGALARSARGALAMSAAGSLTPASELLELAARGDPSLAAHPEQLYARFNCAYVAGMAVGPGALAWLVQVVGARNGSALLALGSATLAAALALALWRELERLSEQLDGDGEGSRGATSAVLAEHLLAAAYPGRGMADEPQPARRRGSPLSCKA